MQSLSGRELSDRSPYRVTQLVVAVATSSNIVDLEDHAADLHGEHDLSALRAQRLHHALHLHVCTTSIVTFGAKGSLYPKFQKQSTIGPVLA